MFKERRIDYIFKQLKAGKDAPSIFEHLQALRSKDSRGKERGCWSEAKAAKAISELPVVIKVLAVPKNTRLDRKGKDLRVLLKGKKRDYRSTPEIAVQVKSSAAGVRGFINRMARRNHTTREVVKNQLLPRKNLVVVNGSLSSSQIKDQFTQGLEAIIQYWKMVAS